MSTNSVAQRHKNSLTEYYTLRGDVVMWRMMVLYWFTQILVKHHDKKSCLSQKDLLIWWLGKEAKNSSALKF